MTRRSERGATLVLVAVGMLALLAMAGLAIDTAHVLLNKSRLQSALDASALAAAKILSQSTNTASATLAAGSLFTSNLAQYPELQRAVTAGLKLTTEYSNTLNPFSPGTAPPLFVRTSIAGFTTPMSLIAVLGINSINVAGSAVAGPSPALTTECNIVPVFVCADTTKGTAPLFNYSVGQVLALNLTAGTTSTIGPGNYGLLRLSGPGGTIVENNLAGDYANCASVNDTPSTQPGVLTGPVSDGINTRFDQYKGNVSNNQSQYPTDPIYSASAGHQTSLNVDSKTGDTMQGTTDISQITPANQAAALTFNYAKYTSTTTTYDMTVPPAVLQRRVLAVPLGDCTGLVNGTGTVKVNGFACVFLLQAVGQGAKNNQIFAEVTSGCDATGTPGTGGTSLIGPYKIELYKSAGSPDS
jgi:Flp pilus assembly protein TadG